MKILNEVLYAWNMKMNTAKTSETSDIITSSVKPEKLEEIYTSPLQLPFQKSAMRIYQISKKYPNAGLVAKNLTDYFDRLKRGKRSKDFDFEVVVAIMTMIAYYSPKYMPQVASIITTIIQMSDTRVDRNMIISKIVDKFEYVPNTEFIDVWLQRITGADEINTYDFKSTITKVATAQQDNSVLWNSHWLNDDDKRTIEAVRISDLPQRIEEHSFSPIIERDEFELYRGGYD